MFAVYFTSMLTAIIIELAELNKSHAALLGHDFLTQKQLVFVPTP